MASPAWKVGEAAAAGTRLARAVRNGEPTDVVEQLRRDYRIAALAARVRYLVDQAPPLTDDQRRRIAALLWDGG